MENNYCVFLKVDDSVKPWKCSECDYRCKIGYAKRSCPAKHNNSTTNATLVEIDSKKPSLLKQATHFGKAVVKDLANGMKRCTDEQIEERLSICQECPFFIKQAEGKGSCLKCGCAMSRDRVYLNKVAWESEHCPINKW